jgi:hypothetical protein
MVQRKRRVLKLVGSIVVAALLLVPLALGGHHHDGPASRACATCVVAQHSPAVQAAPLGLDAPAFRASSFPRTAPRLVVRLTESPAHGRAPPHAPSRAA